MTVVHNMRSIKLSSYCGFSVVANLIFVNVFNIFIILIIDNLVVDVWLDVLIRKYYNSSTCLLFKFQYRQHHNKSHLIIYVLILQFPGKP
jgi:hypothetical protein